jgi:hypothetical protein
VERALEVPNVRVTGINMLMLFTIPIPARILLSGDLPAWMIVIYQTTSARIKEKKDGIICATICLTRSHVS